AFGKCLRIVLKGIGRSFGCLVDNGQHTAFFHQVELYASSLPFDRTRLDISGDTQAKRISLVAHLREFLDGLVIALSLLHAGERKVAERDNDDRDGTAEL